MQVSLLLSHQIEKNMPFIKLQIDIIEEIEKLTLNNYQFDVKKWCLNDAEILIKAGIMIKRELKKYDNEQLNLTQSAAPDSAS